MKHISYWRHLSWNSIHFQFKVLSGDGDVGVTLLSGETIKWKMLVIAMRWMTVDSQAAMDIEQNRELCRLNKNNNNTVITLKWRTQPIRAKY